jgi:hypothetical protein
MPNPTFKNIMMRGVTYGIQSSAGFGTDALNAFMPGWVFTKNGVGNISATGYPVGNTYESLSAWQNEFANYSDNGAVSDYALANASSLKLGGTDGKDVGADMSLIATAIAGVAAPSSVLPMNKITVAGCFLMPGTQTGTQTTTYPVAMRRVAGARRYFQMGGDGQVYDSSEPALKPCDTPIGSLNVGSFVSTAGNGGVWGSFTVNGSDHFPPTDTYALYQGLHWDEPLQKLVATWASGYTGLPPNLNSMVVLTLNSGAGTLSVNGCYAFPYTQSYTAGGVIDIPSDFVNAKLGGTKRWGLAGGIFASATSGDNYGPGLIAYAPLTGTPGCSSTDNLQPAGVKLAEYAGNTNGNTCSTDGTHVSGSFLGCTPSPTVFAPHPALMQFPYGFYDLYNTDWDPCGAPCGNATTKGYFADNVIWRQNWYHDSVYDALVVPFTTTSGYLKTTIVSTTGPGQVRLASLDMHDGYHLNVGDSFTIKTCQTGVDAGCEVANNNEFSVVMATSVNVSTGDVTYALPEISPSHCTVCNNTPIVGAPAYGGPVYPHAIPGWTRSRIFLQLWDTSQFASVIDGAPVYSPTYHEEASLYDMGVTNLGEPVAGGGIQAGFTPGSQLGVTSVVVDPAAQQIVIFIKAAQIFGGTIPRSMGIVLNVIH